MRTIEALATVDEGGTIRVPGHREVPPGEHRIVIVIDESLAPEREDPPESLPDRQYRLASEFPGEYVVLVGERVVHHSADLAEAGRAYEQAFADKTASSPVMVDPNRPRQRRPMIRDRRLSRRPRS